jgi:hypothetical protein
MFDLDLRVERPDGSHVGVPLNDNKIALSAVFDQTGRAGIYQVQLATTVDWTELYAVNVDERESDLTVARQTDLSSELFTDVNVALRGPGGPAIGVFRSSANSTMSLLSRILAWTVLCTLLLEPLLAWQFSWGIVAFGTAVLAALLAPALGWAATAVIGLAGSAGVIWWTRINSGNEKQSVAD